MEDCSFPFCHVHKNTIFTPLMLDRRVTTVTYLHEQTQYSFNHRLRFSVDIKIYTRLPLSIIDLPTDIYTDFKSNNGTGFSALTVM